MMKLFGFGKKKEEKESVGACRCGCSTAEPADRQLETDAVQGAASPSCSCPAGEGSESILILGSGCKNCQALEANTRAALKQMGDTSTIGHVTDFAEIAKYGVMRTPGLVVDGKVVSCGQVLKPEAIAALLKKVRS